MAIRIMHVVDSLGKGGLENGLVNIVQRLDPDRFEHIVLAMRELGPSADRLPRDRVRIECVGKKAGSRIQLAALVRAIREFEPDIVHSRNWGAIEAVVAGRWVGSCAIVHSDHGLEADVRAREPWRRICFRRVAYEMADRILSVSYQLRNLHAQRTGFPARKIAVIHNGVDSRRFRPQGAVRARVREELGLSAETFCMGCVGNLLAVKGHVTLLRAVATLPESWDWRLLMIGEGPECSGLEGFASRHPRLRERVSFLGSSNRVAELLNAMDVYVLPSIAEGICNSLLEAMATGLPVVATIAGGNPEVVVDGESGLLVPVGAPEKLTEHLMMLEARRDLRLQLGQRAVQRVQKDFSIDSMVQRYEQLYESLAPAWLAPAGVAAGA